MRPETGTRQRKNDPRWKIDLRKRNNKYYLKRKGRKSVRWKSQIDIVTLMISLPLLSPSLTLVSSHRCLLLHILTSQWVLCAPFSGQNYLYWHFLIFLHLLRQKGEKKRKNCTQRGKINLFKRGLHVLWCYSCMLVDTATLGKNIIFFLGVD